MKLCLPTLVIVVVASLVAAPGTQAEARPPLLWEDLPEAVLYAGDEPSPVAAALLGPGEAPPDPLPFPRSALGAGIVVTYHDFTPEAQAAFQVAVDYWQTQLANKVPIEIDAYWKRLPGTVLGSAKPNGAFSMFPNAPTGAFYPVPLANQIAGKDLAPNQPDIIANFNSGQKKWYFGADGRPSATQSDFVTVVMHEIGHGLGLTGSLDVVGVNGTWGKVPTIFDAYVLDANGTALVTGYKNKSPELKAALLSGKLFWGGPSAGGAGKVRLFSPPKWDDGSSVFHLDETTYSPSSANALMTPVLNPGEAVRSMGPLIRGILTDMGWVLEDTTPVQLVFLSGFGVGTPGQELPIQPSVGVANGSGTVVMDEAGTVVSLRLVGSGSLSCSGGLSVRTVRGTASFRGCRVDGSGVDFRLEAAVEGLPPAQSAAFAVVQRGGFRAHSPGVGRD